MILREHYLSKIRGFYDSDIIKIIVGIRRCGKSIILEQIRDELKKKTDKILYLNLEDYDLEEKIKDARSLLDYINEHKKEGRNYIFLDEVQNINDWAKACRSLRLEHSLFITGSNSKLLSREFTRELSGRYVSFRIKPFVYKEIKEYAKELNKEVSIEDYLTYGGFPAMFNYNTKEEQKEYLINLNETIIFNDLINRYHIRKVDIFKRIANFIFRSNARIYSVSSIHKFLNNQDITCSVNTIMKYLSYLEEAYAINSISPYDTKIKRELLYYKKIYDEDVSFNTIRASVDSIDVTHNLENIVYNELIYMGYELYVYTNKNGNEVDFFAYKDNKKYYIQVCYTLVDEKTREREFKPFKELDNDCGKIIITYNDPINWSNVNVRHLNLKEFLLLEDL